MDIVLAKIPHARPTSESVPVDEHSQKVYISSVLILQKEGTRPSALIWFTWVLLIVMWVLQESCSVHGSVWLLLCVWYMPIFLLGIHAQPNYRLHLGLQWEWDRRIPSLGFKFHPIVLQWVRKEHFPAAELHWIQQARAALTFNFETLKTTAQ